MEKPRTGLDDCQRMLQACFRKKMSVPELRLVVDVDVVDVGEGHAGVVLVARHGGFRRRLEPLQEEEEDGTSFLKSQNDKCLLLCELEMFTRAGTRLRFIDLCQTLELRIADSD